MHKEVKGYFLFDSISHVLNCEKLCVQNMIACKLGPVPRGLSSDCGVCLFTSEKLAENIRVLIEKNGLRYSCLCYL